jgi:hypothetical protein
MKCLRCQAETANPMFCSRSCATIHHNSVCPKRKPKERICVVCGKSFSIARRKRCAECQAAGKYRISQSFHRKESVQYTADFYKLLTIGDYKNRPSNKSKHPIWAHNNIRGFCRSWNKALQKLPCQRCQYSLHVELCHIRPLADFPETTTLGEVNHPSNIAVLCPNCHWEFDHGLLKL